MKSGNDGAGRRLLASLSIQSQGGQMGITGLGSSHKSLRSVDIVFHFTAASQKDAYWNLRCVPQEWI